MHFPFSSHLCVTLCWSITFCKTLQNTVLRNMGATWQNVNSSRGMNMFSRHCMYIFYLYVDWLNLSRQTYCNGFLINKHLKVSVLCCIPHVLQNMQKKAENIIFMKTKWYIVSDFCVISTIIDQQQQTSTCFVGVKTIYYKVNKLPNYP